MSYQIDRERCLCCHNCALECPVGAITYVGTSYMVDEDRCISCGHCEQVCNVEAARNMEAAEPVAEPHDDIFLEASIVVLGAGASGLVAAAYAAFCSHQAVILLEKAKKYGGSGWFAGFVAPAPGEKALLPPNFAQVRDDLLRGGIDSRIMDLALDTPAEFFQWFRWLDERVDELWQEFRGPDGAVMLDIPGRVFFNTKCTDRAIGPGRSTSVIEKIIADHLQELGITLLTSHRAVSIQRDGSGKVCGVTAEDPGGRTIIRCRAVICCTGGFANNKELLLKYAPQYYGDETDEPTHRFADPTNTGDVVPLGQSAGAYLDYDNFFANVFGPVHHPFSFCLFNFANQGEVVTVNLDGKRFMDESVLGAGAAQIPHQPKRIAWSILDSKTRQRLGERFQHGPDAKEMKEFEREFEEEAALGVPLKIADSLDELARLCGIDENGLAQTILQYNQFCTEGNDRDFHKRSETLWPVVEPPFYAIYGKMACDGAFGGMLINDRMQVYNAEKSDLIPGLFAAGDNSSGWALRPPNGEDRRLMVSTECTWAISSGFIAGREAAQYVCEKSQRSNFQSNA